MAPEQARGRATDRRVDVWAFGCVLFEMLSGQQTFPGSDVTEVLATVLKSEPEWNALPESTPPRLRRVLERCLQKDPKLRLRDIGDVRLALDGAFETVVPAVVPASVPPPRRSYGWPAAVVAVALVAAALTWFLTRTVAEPIIAKRFSLVLPTGDFLPFSSGTMVAISPDGKTMAYRAARDGMRLFVRRIDQFDATPIAEPNLSEAHFFSDDSQWIAYVLNNTLKKVPVAGGPSETIAALGDVPRGGDWRYGTIALAGTTLSTVPESGGTPAVLATAPPGRRFWYPQLVSDGRAILYTSSLPRPDGGDIEVLDVTTKTSRKLLPGVGARLLPTGHLIFIRGNSLWAVKFDAKNLQVQGTPVPIVEGVRVETGGAIQYSVSRDGTLMYIPGSSLGLADIVWIDRAGRHESVGVPRRAYFSVRIDPTGKQVALDVRDQGSEGGDVWVLSLGRQSPTRVTFDPAEDVQPTWTPDGRLLFMSRRDSGMNAIYLQRADGTGTAQKIADGPAGIDQPMATPDGKYIVARASEDIILVDMNGKEPVKKLTEEQFRQRSPEVSRNGRWLAYQSDESGSFQIYVRPFPDVGKGKWQVSDQGGSRAVWAHNGRELFYVASDQSVMSVAFTEENGAFVPSTPKKLTTLPQQPAGAIRAFDVSLDDQRFLSVKSDGSTERAEINVVVNWFEELKKRVPID